MSEEKKPFPKFGALWTKKNESGKVTRFGIVTINDVDYKFNMITNQQKEPGDKKPDYILVSDEAFATNTPKEYSKNKYEDEAGDLEDNLKSTSPSEGPNGEPW